MKPALVPEPKLSACFTYDHTSGTYTCHLENGAEIPFDRRDVSGRLQNALILFAKAVVNTEGGKWRKVEARPSFEYSYDESMVRKFSKNGPAELPELELDLEELGEE